MHNIEPFYLWRDIYCAEEDPQSPFYGRTYSEFTFTQQVYNYYIHPQWDDFGSSTLYLKILYVNYDDGFCVIEFIGEWNDCLYDDFYVLKKNILDDLMALGVHKFLFSCAQVMNFHSGDIDYYELFQEELDDAHGWMVMVNALPHVYDELSRHQMPQYIFMEESLNNFNWRQMKPEHLGNYIERQFLSRRLKAS